MAHLDPRRPTWRYDNVPETNRRQGLFSYVSHLDSCGGVTPAAAAAEAFEGALRAPSPPAGRRSPRAGSTRANSPAASHRGVWKGSKKEAHPSGCFSYTPSLAPGPASPRRGGGGGSSTGRSRPPKPKWNCSTQASLATTEMLDPTPINSTAMPSLVERKRAASASRSKRPNWNYSNKAEKFTETPYIRGYEWSDWNSPDRRRELQMQSESIYPEDPPRPRAKSATATVPRRRPRREPNAAGVVRNENDRISPLLYSTDPFERGDISPRIALTGQQADRTHLQPLTAR